MDGAAYIQRITRSKAATTMQFAAKVWKILVGVKDALVLLLMLLFFGALFAALSHRPSPAMIREGALYLPLDGRIVEEKTRVAPLSLFLSGQRPDREFLARDLVRAIEAAAASSTCSGSAPRSTRCARRRSRCWCDPRSTPTGECCWRPMAARSGSIRSAGQ